MELFNISNSNTFMWLKYLLITTIVISPVVNVFSQSNEKTKIFDSIRLHNCWFLGASNTLAFSNYRDFSGTSIKKYNQFEFTVTPKIAYFVINNLAVGFKWQYGWYWSDFGRTEPNTSSKSIYFEYYFTNWRVYDWNTVKRKNKTKAIFHPLINASINMSNYYYGIDSSLKGKGAIPNNRNDNISYTVLLGFNLNIMRKISFHFALGTNISGNTKYVLQRTRVIKSFRQSDLGIAYFIPKKKKKII